MRSGDGVIRNFRLACNTLSNINPLSLATYQPVISTTKRLFHRQGFRIYVQAQQAILVGIAFPQTSHVNPKRRLCRAFESLQHILMVDHSMALDTYGASEFQYPEEPIHEAYRRADHSISLKPHDGGPSFYEDQGVSVLLRELEDAPRLREYAYHELRPLLNQSSASRHSLLATLKAYIDAGGSAKRAAETLHIHRQTLYYRVAQLQNLFGEDVDLTDPEIRTSLALALRIYHQAEHIL